ncbi:hypothetical protein QR46_2141 [Giardia duodenalis assemblage B]|uniref:Uncharacterized protein n=3 Tax=Giardia intestinalis TaxID=5741 RepID=A0A132NUV1_GIAIN|nr:Hypothetical protein GL50581_2974 [Giardia intestinalis ATCC 50581]ESU43322.1 Hypothetical protein GSB_7413 [Giardia intestinalis]KWX13859.1 hypothetical protein QR46_2141 [Giardia intestinalis assemblage B]
MALVNDGSVLESLIYYWTVSYYNWLSNIKPDTLLKLPHMLDFQKHPNKQLGYILVDNGVLYNTLESAYRHRADDYGAKNAKFSVDTVISSITFPMAKEPNMQFYQVLVQGTVSSGHKSTPFLSTITLGAQLVYTQQYSFYPIQEIFQLLT